MTDVIAGSLGGLNIYWYGLTVSLAIIMGILVTRWLVYLRREDFSVIIDILLYGIPAAFVVSRLLYVIRHWSIYSGNISEVFMVNHGGMSIYGAFIGFVAVLLWYTYQHGLSVYHWLDILSPAIVLGLFINQCSHFVFQANIGLPVAEAVAAHSQIIQYVEYAFRPSGFEGYEYFRPVALYQSIWLLFVFVLTIGISLWRSGRLCRQKGSLALLSILMVLVGRFYFGFLYLTTNPSGNLHFGQIVSLIGIFICGGLLLSRYLKSRRGRRGTGFYLSGRN